MIVIYANLHLNWRACEKCSNDSSNTNIIAWTVHVIGTAHLECVILCVCVCVMHGSYVVYLQSNDISGSVGICLFLYLSISADAENLDLHMLGERTERWRDRRLFDFNFLVYCTLCVISEFDMYCELLVRQTQNAYTFNIFSFYTLQTGLMLLDFSFYFSCSLHSSKW